MWVYTKKGELRAKEKGLEPRLEHTPAFCGNQLVDGQVATAWYEKGYIALAALHNAGEGHPFYYANVKKTAERLGCGWYYTDAMKQDEFNAILKEKGGIQ